ncbi:hypothetical protein LIER_23065 [Lithospermum erythrorhizon]|uniref:Uncharacterized protein n=1 Tax=Lithospermum erythrorhizon TaxID=34254 RepID=A0AAV3QW31_LITER
MGEEEKCPRKQLDFNAPILSLRQPTHINRSRRSLRFSRVASWDASSNRVPFSWERIPGKPKETETTIWDSLRDDIPTPKLPPGRRHPLLKEVLNGALIEQQQQQQHIDDNCDADNEDDDHTDEANHSTISFQALDIFSLCESLDNVEQGESRRDNGVEEEWHSANFMIQRFLPDARALAASSSLAAAKIIYDDNKNINTVYSANCVKVGKLNHSSKNCGLDHFLPWWKMKPKLCRGKNTDQKTPSKLNSHHLCTRNIQKQPFPETPRSRRKF